MIMVSDIEKIVEKAEEYLKEENLEGAENVLKHVDISKSFNDAVNQRIRKLKAELSSKSLTKDFKSYGEPNADHNPNTNEFSFENEANLNEVKINEDDYKMDFECSGKVDDLNEKTLGKMDDENSVDDWNTNYENTTASDIENKSRNILISEMIQNFMKIRSQVLLIGCDLWDKHPKIEPTTRVFEIKREVEYLIESADSAFWEGDLDTTKKLMNVAERWYDNVMPKRAYKKEDPINKNNKPLNINDHSTVVVYKVTSKGDKIDLVKSITGAKKALADEKLDKAKRLINKAKKIFDDNAAEFQADKTYATTLAVIERIMEQIIETEDAAKKKLEPVQPKVVVNKSPVKEVDEKTRRNKELVTRYIKLSDDAFFAKNYIEAREHLLNAKRIDSTMNLEDQLKDVEAILKHKSTEAYNIAKENILREDYYCAEKHLKEALRLCATKEVIDALEKTTAELLHRKKSALFLLERAEEAKENRNYYKAEEFLVNAKQQDPAIDVTDKLVEIREHIKICRSQASGCIMAADEAIKNKDFYNAEKCLMQAQQYDPKSNVQAKLSHVNREIQILIHQASSCVAAADEAIKSKDFPNAERWLIQAEVYNPNIDVQSKKAYVKSQIASIYKKAALKDKAEEHLQEAEKAFFENDLDFAEELVRKANSLCFLDKSKELSTKIIASRSLVNYNNLNTASDTNNESPLGNERAMIDSCLSKANTAYEKGDLDTAIHFYEKAFRMEPSCIAANILQKLKAEKEQARSSNKPNTTAVSTEKLPELRQRAHRYYKFAVAAAKLKKYDLALNHLHESIQIHQTEEAQKLLKEVQEAKSIAEKGGEISDDDESSDPGNSNFKDPDESPNANAVSKYTGYALDDMHRGLHYAAESWLKLANGIHESDTANQLLKTVTLTLKNDNVKNTKNANLKQQSKIYLEKASSSFLKGKFDEASLSVVISENIYTKNGSARDLMEKIFQNQYCKKHNCLISKVIGKKKNKFNNISETKRFDIFMSDCYYRVACIALRMDNSDLAVQYLEKSLSYYRTSDRTTLLTEVRSNKNKEPGIWKRFKNFFKFSK